MTAALWGAMHVNKDSDVAARLGLGESRPRAAGLRRGLLALLVTVGLAGAVLLWLALDKPGAAQYRTAVLQRGAAGSGKLNEAMTARKCQPFG